MIESTMTSMATLATTVTIVAMDESSGVAQNDALTASEIQEHKRGIRESNEDNGAVGNHDCNGGADYRNGHARGEIYQSELGEIKAIADCYGQGQEGDVDPACDLNYPDCDLDRPLARSHLFFVNLTSALTHVAHLVKYHGYRSIQKDYVLATNMN